MSVFLCALWLQKQAFFSTLSQLDNGKVHINADRTQIYETGEHTSFGVVCVYILMSKRYDALWQHSTITPKFLVPHPRTARSPMLETHVKTCIMVYCSLVKT